MSLLAGLVAATAAALIVAWRGCWRPPPGPEAEMDARLATLVLATLLLTPYLFFYDSVLLAVAGVYTLRTLPVRPAAHAWLVLAFTAVVFLWVGGLTEALKLLPFRVQLAPAAFLGWLWLEAAFVASQARR